LQSDSDRASAKVWHIGKREGMAQGKREGMALGKREGMAQGKREGMAQGKREGMAEGMAQLGIIEVLDMLDEDTRGKRKEVERKLRYNPNPSPERRDG
jgi:flagellar biosynthesis/type III secretory pathway protein FliH